MSVAPTETFSAAESLPRLDGRASQDRWLTPASIGISLVLVGTLAYFLPYLYLRLNLRVHSGAYLPVVAVFPVLVLLGLNGLLRAFGIGLRRGEVTVILCSLMVALSTLMTVAMLFTQLVAPVRAASPQNKFNELFLWSVDTRLLPYTPDDKERESAAGQYDESLNWYFMGVPDVAPVKAAERRPSEGAANATTAPARASDAAAAVRAKRLAIPWWRWCRRFSTSAEDRVRAYEVLAGRVRAAKQLDTAAARELLAQVDVLKGNVRSGVSLAPAYARMEELLTSSTALDRDVRDGLRVEIKREHDFDEYLATHAVPAQRVRVDRPWYLWTGPLVWWLILLTLFVVLQFCLVAILRRQWVDHEKLLFPHAEILEAVTEPGASGTPGGGVFRSRLTWVGFGAAVLLFATEGLHAYYPGFPAIGLETFTLGPVLNRHPWNAIPSGLNLHLFIIAIAFVLPSEISFSVWAFVLLDFALRSYMNAAGYTYHQSEPMCGYLINGGTKQVTGMVVFLGVLMFSGRRHLGAVLRKAFGGGRDVDDSDEPLPYLGAFWGLVLSAFGIIVWCYVMGMSPVLSLVMFGLTVIGIMFLTRVVCELGIVTSSYQEPSMPQYILAGTVGYRNAGDVVRWSFWDRMLFMTPTYATWAFLWAPLFYCTHVMPLAMTSERLYRRGQSRRRFTFFLLVLTLGVMVVFAVRSIAVPYEESAIKLKQGRQASAGHSFDNCLVRDFMLKEAMAKPFPPMYVGAIIGAIVMAVLLLLRHLFYWWPLHPIGFICTGLSEGVWFSVLIGWFIKRAVLKYGGGRLFRKAIPLFVGLLVGHVVIAGVWMVVACFVEAQQGVVTYSAIWSQP